jgi:dolichol-phosphate mannosyltransferase
MTASTLIVVPTFNEVENVARLVTVIHEALPSANVLVVDDASPDGTAGIVRQLAKADPRVHLLERSSKLGLGSAYVAGFVWGLERDFAHFFQMDADFSHDPRALPVFVAALNAGADVVVGSRNVPGGTVEGWGLFRHILSKGGSFYSRVILHSAVRDMTSGFKGYTRRALERVEATTMRSNGYAFQIETTYRALRAGLRVVELPIVFVDRRVGQSKMTRHEIAEAVTSVWRMRFGRRYAP